MIPSKTPFTEIQQKFITALSLKLKEIDNPEGYTHNLSYSWSGRIIEGKGFLPTILFKPRGQANRIKKDVIEEAGLLNHALHGKLDKVREKHGFKVVTNRAANYFNFLLDSLMFQTKKRLASAALIQQAFCKPSETISKPIQIINSSLGPEYGLRAAKTENMTPNPTQDQKTPENASESHVSNRKDIPKLDKEIRQIRKDQEPKGYESELEEVR